MAEVRYAHAVAVLDGKLYAVGGGGAAPYHHVLSSVERYDPTMNAWEAAAAMRVGHESRCLLSRCRWGRCSSLPGASPLRQQTLLFLAVGVRFQIGGS